MEFVLKDPVLPILQQLIRAGDTIIDVGGNRGTYAYVMKRCVGEQGLVVSFEPQKTIFETLRKNIGNSVVVENMAVSDKTASMDFYVHLEGSGPSSSLRKFDDLESIGKLKTTSVGTTTLDDYWEQSKNKNEIISLVKIDTEGCDFNVIIGSEKIIKNSKPVIIFEFIPGLSNRSVAQRAVKVLKNYYEAKVIETGENFFELIDFEQELEKTRIINALNYNVLCTPKTD